MEKFFAEWLARLETEPEKLSELLLAAEAEFVRAGYRKEISAGVENILIVRLDRIGDMFLTSGFLREVRANFPRARITLVCMPQVFSVVELCPYVNEVLTFDRNALSPEMPVMFEQIVTFCREKLWRRRFSMALLPQWGANNFPGLLIAWLSGARERIGYCHKPYISWVGEPAPTEMAIDNFLLTNSVVSPRSAVAEIQKHYYLLTAMGLPIERDNVELFYGAADVLRARELLRGVAGKKVILGIGAGDPNRKYPAEKFLPALKVLAAKDLCFVIVGGQSELDDANLIEHNLPSGKVLNLAGKTTLRETEAVIAQADYYVGTDSGVMHMAAASKIPCLVLYREAQDKEDYLPGAFSEYGRFPPWQTKSVILRPDHPLPECEAKGETYGWCHSDEPHCITQITPQEIVNGFTALEEL